MSTTTAGAIIAHLVTRITAIVPETVVNLGAPPTARGFRYNDTEPSRPLRRWLPDAGGNDMFRRFDLEEEDGPADIGIVHPDEKLMFVRLLVTLAYPARPTLFGLTSRRALKNLIEIDTAQVVDELASPSAILAGDAHQANADVRALRPDRLSEDHWFQDVSLTAVFYTAQRS